jgi:predicted deacylase
MKHAESIAAATQAPPGHYYVETPVTIMATGQPLTYAAHILRGEQPGPRIGILSGLHGDEFSTAVLVLSLFPLLELNTLVGTVVLVPMANSLGFEAATRSTPHDMANLNRVFPGNPRGTVTEILAAKLTETFIRNCDVIFDLHSEPDTMNIRCFYTALPVDDYGKRALALSKASGCPLIFTTKAIGGSLAETAQALGVLAVMPETGGPLPGPAGLMKEAQSEILNMLRYLRVIPGQAEEAGLQVIVDAVTHIRAPVGGLFHPVMGFDGVCTAAAKDQLLGTIISPYSGLTLAELRAPHADSWMKMVRGRISRVHPGDPLYIIGRAAAGC